MKGLIFSSLPRSSAAGGSALSPRAAAAKKAEIDQERRELLAKRGLVESEKAEAQRELERREEELTKAQ